MFKKVSRLIKFSAYLFLVGNILNQAYYITVNTSYLNTGELMGVESMMQMIWACFMSFLMSLGIYGFGEILSYYEKEKSKLADDLTKSHIDVK